MAKYGTVKYNEEVYGGEQRPFSLRLILRNNKNDVANLISLNAKFHDFNEPYKYGQRKYGQAKYGGENRQPILLNASWEYNRIGGCGSGSFTVALPYQSLETIEEGSELRVDVIDEQGELYTTWYTGEIISRTPVFGAVSVVNLQTQGFVMQLERILLEGLTFADSDTDDIVKFIIDNHVSADTQIVRTDSKGLVRTEGFVVDTITFNGSAMDAMRSLAEITGNAEWGVDNDKEIFFVVRSREVKNSLIIDSLTNFDETSNFSTIINEYKLIGASGFDRTNNDLPSQNKFGKRTATIQQTAISSNAVADQFIDGFLTDTKAPLKTVAARTGNIRNPIEVTPPQGQVSFSLLGSSPFVKTDYQMESVNYTIANGKGLFATIIGGKIKEDITETIGYLTYRIDQLQNR